ncbi:ATP-binding protein [Roseofilum sp. Guam]|uniref:hybrid sensor histidine kinase/response regulator n=1 Tax=Roseofilum sp. Guam TaxID=2821502 RepID=UPI00298E4A7B|nr:ATP-binding protein [Roseofilum sp. Guam]
MMNLIKILVVEDERIIAMDIRNSLQRMGYAVVGIVSSGEKALEKVPEVKPDLVLMDIVLKGEMDGIEAGKKIIHNFKIPVVYLTSHTDPKTLERAKKTNPFGYIVKPFEERDLNTTLDIALARAQVEIEMEKNLAKERELVDLKSRFITMVSHEFRTPLATILFSAGLLEKYSHKWTEDKKQIHFDRIKSGVQRMTRILEDILVIGQADPEPLNPKPKGLDIQTLCTQMIDEIKTSSKTHIDIEFKTDALHTHQVYLDPELMGHIVYNLLSNAVNYSPKGSQAIVELANQDKNLILKVEDRGMGISRSEQEHLFKSFYRGSEVENIPGTGLGLAIVKRAVDLQQGEITVESEVGVGSTFTVVLPLNLSETDYGENSGH